MQLISNNNKRKMRKRKSNLPSELDDFIASVCTAAANALVLSNNNSWNCFESTGDGSPNGRRVLIQIKIKKQNY